MSLIEDSTNEIRKRDFPTDREVYIQQMQQMYAIRKKFMESMVNFVEKSVIEKKKVVRIPISKRDDIAKLRKLIKRIANNLGYNVKSVKKRWVIVENTKFIVEKIAQPSYTITESKKFNEKSKNPEV